MSNVIRLKKASRKAFNPNRPLERNLLVTAQVRHFKEADEHLPPEWQTGVDVASIKTEGEAADYIRKVTRAIHKSGGSAPQDVRTAR